MKSIRLELSRLLDESPRLADDRVAAYVGDRVSDWKRLVLYGAGNIGKLVLTKLLKTGIRPLAFIDDTPGRQGSEYLGVPILSEAAVFQSFGEEVCLIVCISKMGHHYPRTEERIRSERGWKCLSFFALAWAQSGRFGPMLHFESPSLLLRDADNFLRVEELCSDDKSKQELARQVAFRLTLDFSVLGPPDADAYFPPDVPLGLSPDLTFIDAGAYNGDTVLAFVNATNSEFHHVIAIEADPLNYSQLQRTVLENSLSHRVACKNLALSGRSGEMLAFNATGDMAASLSEAKGSGFLVSSTTIAEISPIDHPVYIKFDIEGAEWEALTAADRYLKIARPQMAISVYHDPKDLWRIPLYLNSLDSGYRFWIRNHGFEGTDVVCYAVSRA